MPKNTYWDLRGARATGVVDITGAFKSPVTQLPSLLFSNRLSSGVTWVQWWVKSLLHKFCEAQLERNRGGAIWAFNISSSVPGSSICRQCHASLMWGFWWHLFYSKPIYPGLFPVPCEILWFIQSLFSIMLFCTHADMWQAQMSSQKGIRDWKKVWSFGGSTHCFQFTMPWDKRRYRRLPHQGRFPKMVATCFIPYSRNTVFHLSITASYLRSPCLHSQSLNHHKLMSRCWAPGILVNCGLSVRCKTSSLAVGLKAEGCIRERVLY